LVLVSPSSKEHQHSNHSGFYGQIFEHQTYGFQWKAEMGLSTRNGAVGRNEWNWLQWITDVWGTLFLDGVVSSSKQNLDSYLTIRYK
jgi:hypothetical protein